MHHIEPRQTLAVSQNLRQIPIHKRRQRPPALSQPRREHQTRPGQLLTHAHPLTTLAGEDEHHRPGRSRCAADDPGGRFTGGERRQWARQVVAGRAVHHGPVLQCGAGGRQ
jgi:hypothetical protein